MKINREEVKLKFDNKCAYSGTLLEDDWQVEHIIPKSSSVWLKDNNFREEKGIYYHHKNHIDNLIPVQRIINHYKRGLSLEEFRNWYLAKLHIRLAKFPKKTNSPTTKKRMLYLHKVASYFDIRIDKPFEGVFYFEKLKKI